MAMQRWTVNGEVAQFGIILMHQLYGVLEQHSGRGLWVWHGTAWVITA